MNTLRILKGPRGYYWHLKSPNGRILSGSTGDGFKRLAGLVNNLDACGLSQRGTAYVSFGYSEKRSSQFSFGCQVEIVWDKSARP